MGGLAPDISRNTFGLQGSVSFLLETRGVGIGRDHFLRRVHTHVVALEAVLRTTADNADRVMRTVAGIREAIARSGAAGADRRDVEAEGRRAHARDARPGNRRRSSADGRRSTIRSRPSRCSCVRVRSRTSLPPAYRDLARRLALNGVAVERLARPRDARRRRLPRDRQGGVAAATVEGHVRVTVRTELVRRRMAFPAGSFVVRMAQPNALLAAVALEPESASSFVTIGSDPGRQGGHGRGRVERGARLPAAPRRSRLALIGGRVRNDAPFADAVAPAIDCG